MIKCFSFFYFEDSILENGTITLSFQFAMDLPVSAVHLRIHKNKTEDSIISSIQECDLEQEGITISVNVRNPQKVGEVITLHQLNINYNELLNEKWLDFDSLSIISNYNYIHNNTMELYLKLETANKCPSLTIKDMGITLQNEYEPVIVMYMSDNSKSLQIEQQINETIINDRRKRAVEGSGIETEFCRLIDHKVSHPLGNKKMKISLIIIVLQVSYVHLMQSSGMEGKFEMNYCSGHCIHPVGGNPPLHTKILGYLASQQEDNYNAIIPTPCCVPTRYKTLTIAKYKGYPFNHLFLRSLTNITAKECGCR